MKQKPAEKTEQAKPVSLRLPEDLRKWLKHQAVENDRSLNAEIVASLQVHRDQKAAHAA